MPEISVKLWVQNFSVYTLETRRTMLLDTQFYSKNIEHQQHFSSHSCVVFNLHVNRAASMVY